MNHMSTFDPVTQAVNASRDLAIFMSMRRVMCWTCMENRPVKGGHFTPKTGRRLAGGARRFTCAGCAQAKAERKAAAEATQ